MSIWDAVYYTFFFTGLAYLVSLIVSVHKPMWLLYCVQDLLLGLYFAAFDGDLANWLGFAPEFQDALVLSTGVVLLVFGFLAQASLISPTHSFAAFKKPLRWLAFVTLALLPLGMLLEAQWFQPLVVVLAVLGLLSMLVPPLTWSFLPMAAKQIAMPTIVLVVLVIAAILLLGLSFFELTTTQAQSMRRLIMVWSIVAGVITMAYMTRNIEQTRRREANRALRAAKKEAELANSLFQAEVEYSRVRDLALERSAQLQGVGHDLRQPLFALHTTLSLLADNKNQELTGQMREALEYADQLASTYLNTAAVETAQKNAVAASEETDAEVKNAEAEAVELSVYLETIQRMYQQQAAAADVEFCVSLSSASIRARPTAVMRVLSNLVSNALQHAQCTKLLLGVRRQAGGVVLELHDNGVGIGSVPSPTVPANDNHGLGLSIVADLCVSAGFSWESSGEPGKGSIMRVGIPSHLVS